MSAYADSPLVDEAPPPSRGWPGLAWVVILLIAGFIVASHGSGPNAAGPAGDERLITLMEERTLQLLIGGGEIARQREDDAKERNVPAPPARGPVKEHLTAIVATGDLQGPQQALARLAQLHADIDGYQPTMTDKDKRTLDILQRLYEDYARGRMDLPSLTEEERAFLREELGWFGALALSPGGFPLSPQELSAAAGSTIAAGVVNDRADLVAPAVQRSLAAGISVGLLLLFGLLGLVGLVVFVGLAIGGRIGSRLACGEGRGRVYAETFALWLLLWVGLSLAAVPLAAGHRLAAAVVASLLSLSALAWPVQRGIPWAQVRQDIGLLAGPSPLLELLAGLATYVMALPMLAAGLIVMLLITQALPGAADGNPFSAPAFPSHPFIEPLLVGDVETQIAILLLATVVAPFVEEIMFRGVLHYHLRDATCRWHTTFSILFSGTLTSFLFAAVHPQGLIAIPLLMALAYAFTLAREWRGVLVPGMIAHGLSNGIMLALLFLIFGP